MKIYYYSGATLPSNAAKSVHVMKMCEALAHAGHDVTLFGKGQGDQAHDHYGTASNFSIKTAPNIKIPLLSGAIRLIHMLITTIKLGKPDLAYGRDPIALLLLPFQSIPIIYEAHQMPYLPSHHVAIKRLAQKPNAKIVAISQILKNDLQAKYPDLNDQNILVAHDGANIPESTPKAKKLTNSSLFNIGYAGALQDGKGSQTLLKIAEQCLDIAFHIFGGHTQEIETLKKSAPANVTFYGHILHKDIPACLAACDALIAPYREKATIKTGQDIARWISPMKIFEYMAAQKPIICSNLDVIREVLHHNENALLVEPENIEDWVSAIRTLQNTPEEGRRLAAQAFKDLKTHYTWQTRAENIIEFVR